MNPQRDGGCGSGEPAPGRFVEIRGLAGRVFVPGASGPRKHPCPECFSCPWCPDARCAACRGGCAPAGGSSEGER